MSLRVCDLHPNQIDVGLVFEGMPTHLFRVMSNVGDYGMVLIQELDDDRHQGGHQAAINYRCCVGVVEIQSMRDVFTRINGDL